ncbi:MAG: TatD family hydrolase [Patescibacteria group bacterium]|jgi:TatD DNase family protein
MYIDTHAHLNFQAFKLDWQQVIERAKKANIKAIINAGSNFETSKKAIEIAEKQENVFAAVGLHPIHVKDEEFDEENFFKLAKNKKVVAIGETGLDYYYDKSNMALQKEVLVKSIKLAQIVSKPIILHLREADEDLLSLLMGESTLPKGVLHCFGGNWQFAQMVLSMGFYISFTGIITFTKNQQTFEVIEKIPLEKILIETDCPYLTPEPYRGQRNDPTHVIEVAKKIAEIKKISLGEVAEQTSKNAIELFKLDLK